MAFYVGQKVVCVDASFEAGRPYWLVTPELVDMDGLREGAVYTIARVSFEGGPYFKPHVCVWLEEIRRETGIGFLASRFRPVVERKTDISIFKAMLNSSDERVPS